MTLAHWMARTVWQATIRDLCDAPYVDQACIQAVPRHHHLAYQLVVRACFQSLTVAAAWALFRECLHQMKTAIRLAKSMLRRMGIVAFKRSSGVYVPDEDSYRIVAELCGRSDPVIIDGGAHRGDSVEAISRLLPKAEFHCFEPDPTLGQELARAFAGRSNVHVVQAALGESIGRAILNINASRPTNSLLPSSASLESGLESLCQTVEQIEVGVTTIDHYRAEQDLRRIDVIKLDLQGYDYKALCGAQLTLSEVRVVLVEVLFGELYEGSGCLSDILRLMEQRGFNLYTLTGLHYGAGDRLLWADAVFLNQAHGYHKELKPQEFRPDESSG